MCIESLPDHLTLSNGFKSLVDHQVYLWASKHKWSYGCRGYAHRRINYKIVYLHRLILNAKSTEIVDHINGNTLDNRLCNLRVASKSLNTLNRYNLDKRNTTGYTGVYFHPTKKYWYGQFKFNKQKYYVPSRSTKEEVHKLRLAMIKEVSNALVCIA